MIGNLSTVHYAAEPPHPGLDALDDGFVLLDAQWRIAYWNPAAAQLLQMTRDQAIGREWWELLPHLRHGEAWTRLHDAQGGERRERFTAALLARRPERRFQVIASPAGERLALQLRAVPAETQAERYVQRYEDLLESIRDGFLAVEADGRIAYLNGTAESLLRLTRERALGTPLWPMLPRRPSSIARTLRATMQDRLQRHLRAVRPEGRRFHGRVFDLWTAPLPGGGLSVLFEDVGERIQTEHELARLAAHAEDASRAKSRFFTAVSHELRTPLNAIVGYTHLLQSQAYGPIPDSAVRAAERAGVCAEHLARLIDDVLVMTTAQTNRLPLSPGPVELSAFLHTVLEPHRQQAEAKRLLFTLCVDPDVPRVETDPERLRQLLGTLLSNAVKFTPRGEVRVTVSFEAHEPHEPGAVLPAAEGYVAIGVHDTGPGIAHEHQQRIFEVFEQLGDPARSAAGLHGAGLGLPLARRLADLLCGTLSLRSRPGEGACFELRLPVRFPGAAP